MKKVTAKLLIFIFIINTLIGNIMNFATFAAEPTTFSFNWDKSKTLNNALNVEPKGNAVDNMFLWWDYGISSGIGFDTGKYNLSYNIQNNKRIDVEVEKKGETSTLSYKVWEYSKGKYIDISDSLYQVYKSATGNFIEPNSTDYAAISEGFEIIYNSEGVPEEVKFSIIKNTGFAFKFDNRTIRFKWVSSTSDMFYFVTDGIAQGNIYDVDLALSETGSDNVDKSLQIFTGINPNAFVSTPYANNRKDIIDHSTRPFPDKDPGYEPEIVMEFAVPKMWDNNTNTYVYPSTSDMPNIEKTSAIIDMGNSDEKKKIQITIDNIYASDINAVTTYTTTSGAIVKTSRNAENIMIELSQLEPGVIYNPVEVSIYQPNNPEFLSSLIEIAQGLVYTYPSYTIVSMSADEFYIKIDTYENYLGYYTIKTGATTATLTQWAEYEDTKGDGSTIYVPVNINAINQLTQFFQVEFKFTPPDETPGATSTVLNSQILKYTPSDEDIVIGTPKNLVVTDMNMVTSKNDADKKEMVLSLKWDIGYREVLRTLVDKNGGSLDVFYTFNRGDMPYDTDEKKFAGVTLTMTPSATNENDVDIKISDTTGFDAVLESSSTSTKSELVNGTRYQTAVAEVTFRIPVAHRDEDNEIFLYPNIYFLNVNGYYYDKDVKINLSASLPVDITLDEMSDAEVPQPQNIAVLDTNENKVTSNSFGIRADTFIETLKSNPMYNYYSKMISARGLTFSEESVKFNIYISQKKSVLDMMIRYDTDRDSLLDEYKEKIKSFDHKNQNAEDSPINLSSSQTEDGTIARDWLRGDNILKIENIVHLKDKEFQTLNLNGLDKNQNYYIVMETVVIPYNEDTSSYVTEDTDHSRYSDMITATTLINDESPSDDENNPPAPKNFVKKEVGLNKATLNWDKVKEVPDPDSKSTLEYQFVRVTSQKMDESYIDKRLKFKEVWDILPKTVEIAGWKTSTNRIYKFDSETETFLADPAPESEFEYDISDYNINQLTDITLMPNELYFYYIRTVRVLDGKDIAYSVWVPLSITTTPVETPKNLKVESVEKYDKKTEVLISFDISNIDPAKIGDEFIVQYALKEDNKDWEKPSNMSSAKLLSDYTVKENGDLHFRYTITGLTTGTLYSIKVRLFDIYLNSASLYSNTVQTRTELDQDDYEDDKETDGWLDFYEDLLEETLQKPYWVIKDNAAATTMVYRPQHFKGVVSNTTSGNIELEKGEGGSKKVYYIPASAIKEAFNANKGFKISWEDMDVVVAGKSINPNINTAILDMEDKIDSKDVKDYFVRITVEFTPVTYTISGNDALSPVANITIDTVGTKKLITLWDEAMTNAFKNKMTLSSHIKTITDLIYNKVIDNVNSEKIVELIKSEYTSFIEDFIDYISDKLDDILDISYTSTTLDGNIIIAFPVDTTKSASGYKQIGSDWNVRTIADYLGKKAIYTTEAGKYVFAGKSISIPGIGNVENGTPITKIIAKFGLDDFLGKDSALNLKADVTKNMAIGCVARVSGAARNDDPNAYLTTRGISISNRNAQGAIASQEAVYLVMMAYQIRTNTKMESVTVRNYAATANITGINPAYKKSVQVAFETGIYNDSNMNPNGNMTVNEFMQMLVKLSNKVNLI